MKSTTSDDFNETNNILLSSHLIYLNLRKMLITPYEYSYLFVFAVDLVAPEEDECLPQKVAAAALEHPEGQILLELHRALLCIQMP